MELLELIEHPAQLAFGQAKAEALPRFCRECDCLTMCNGGCPKDRIIRTPEGEAGLNYLCAGYRKFFAYCRDYTRQMAALRLSGEPAERMMEVLRAEEIKAQPAAGRNDPCPCGSGRKYKKCCLNA